MRQVWLVCWGAWVAATACGRGNCAMACLDSALITLDETVAQSERFTVEVNGTRCFPLPSSANDPSAPSCRFEFDGPAPPVGVAEFRANRIEVTNPPRRSDLVVRWTVDGALWFEQAVHARWASDDVCGMTCWHGAGTLALPDTLPDGTLLADMPPPCRAVGCWDQTSVHLSESVAWQAGMSVTAEGLACSPSSCSFDRSAAPCVVTLLSTAATSDCSAVPPVVDAIVVRSGDPSITIDWQVDQKPWFSVTVPVEYGPAVYPPGVPCDPGCVRGEVSINLPTPPPGAAGSAGVGGAGGGGSGGA